MGSPFGGIPRNWKLELPDWALDPVDSVPPSGGSLEIGNTRLPLLKYQTVGVYISSPFGGIPRNWKLVLTSR